MRLGIIGKGKMGLDIFSYYLDYDVPMVLICRRAEEALLISEKLKKKLQKKVERGTLTRDEFEKKFASIIVSTEYENLEACDMVIETVIENLEVKQEVFKKVSEIVLKECILASNTSSLRLNDIFYDVCNKERCMGLHFFYPLRLIETVEINKTDYLQERYVKKVSKWLEETNRLPIILSSKGNMILSKIISSMVCFAYMIYQEGYLTYREIDEIFKNNIMMFGVFELVDSTGFLIILRCFEQFINERYEFLYSPVAKQICELQKLGYEGNNIKGGFINFEKEHNMFYGNVFECDTERKCYIDQCVDKIKAFIINEIAYYYNNQFVQKTDFPDIVANTLGYVSSPVEWFESYGESRIKKIIAALYQKKKYQFFVAEDYKMYKLQNNERVV